MQDRERLRRPPAPLPVFLRLASVEVYVGAGWQKGSVQDSTPQRCVVWLGQQQRFTTVYDARNLRPWTSSTR